MSSTTKAKKLIVDRAYKVSVSLADEGRNHGRVLNAAWMNSIAKRKTVTSDSNMIRNLRLRYRLRASTSVRSDFDSCVFMAIAITALKYQPSST